MVPPASPGAGPSRTPGPASRQTGPCSSRKTLCHSPPQRFPHPDPRRTSAPRSPVQLDLFLRAADLSPRSWPLWGGSRLVRPAQGREGVGVGGGGLKAGPCLVWVYWPSQRPHSPQPRTPADRQRPAPSPLERRREWTGLQLPGGSARAPAPCLGGPGFPEHCGKRSSAMRPARRV